MDELRQDVECGAGAGCRTVRWGGLGCQLAARRKWKDALRGEQLGGVEGGLLDGVLGGV